MLQEKVKLVVVVEGGLNGHAMLCVPAASHEKGA